MKRALIACLVTVVAAFCVFAAGQPEKTGTSAEAGRKFLSQPGPEGKFEPGITLTTWFQDENRSYAAGEKWDDNRWTRYVKEKLGIEFKYLWSAPTEQYVTKTNISIATGDLADLMSLDWNHYYQMAAAGMLEDLTAAIETYAGPIWKENFTMNEGMLRNLLSYKGRVYGMIAPNGAGEQGYLGYMRKDWLDGLGMKVPATFADFEKMLYAFADKDPDGNGKRDTYGLTMSVDPGLNNVFAGGVPAYGLFEIFDAYPRIWVKGADGKAVYGSTQGQVRDALEWMAKLYKDGVIHRDFPIKQQWVDEQRDTQSGVVGFAQAYFWFPDWVYKNTKLNNPQAEWTVMPIKRKAGGPIASMASIKNEARKVYAMKKGTRYPEAIVKLANIVEPRMAENGTFHTDTIDGKSVSTFFYAAAFAPEGAIPDKNVIQAKIITEALKSRSPEKLTPEMRSGYDRILSYLEKKDPDGYGLWGVFAEGGSMHLLPAQPKKFDEYFGPNTKTMENSWGTIEAQRNALFVQIIVGQKPVTAFDTEWLPYWKSHGGDQITSEVNAWLDSMK